jgi:hypothetical protein
MAKKIACSAAFLMDPPMNKSYLFTPGAFISIKTPFMLALQRRDKKSPPSPPLPPSLLLVRPTSTLALSPLPSPFSCLILAHPHLS